MRTSAWQAVAFAFGFPFFFFPREGFFPVLRTASRREGLISLSATMPRSSWMLALTCYDNHHGVRDRVMVRVRVRVGVRKG